ncbi:unnamed protein product [Plutella xylostella]|uniref:Homologous-pairing protein 2 homolog n=1 Tax=Plutella xylostella TaxID=51655 RepID=A0A8S4F9B4_PLUXY|nr:unnamed protein product [Plutella xylostella]
MASDAVLKYLVDTNRPYSCADITVNLRGAFTKTAVQKALDALSESAKIKCKLYGKQKVYAAIQPETVPVDNDKEEDYETQFKVVAKSLEEQSEALKTSESKLKLLISTPTTDTAISLTNDARTRIEVLESKLNVLRTSTQVLSPEEKRKVSELHSKLLSEYRKRKRICSDMIETMMEGYPKSKKTFLEELCVETDDMVGFKLMT